MSAWQCPGCGTYYSYFVTSCTCQMRFASGNTTNTLLAMPRAVTGKQVPSPSDVSVTAEPTKPTITLEAN